MNIFELFAKAKQTLKWPKLIFKIDGREIWFKPNQSNTTIYINDPNEKRSYDGRSITIGIITKKQLGFPGAKVNWDRNTIKNYPSLRDITAAIIKEPIGFCSLHGLEFSYCCFCGTELTSKESLAVGYGPICADNWGLPWGNTKTTKANSLENL